MAKTRKRRSQETRLISQSSQLFLKQRIIEIWGVLILLLAGLVLISYISYSSDDPSVHVANSNKVTNWLGATSANFAESSKQWLGYGRWLIFIILLSYALYFLSKAKLFYAWQKIKLISIIPAIIFSCMALSILFTKNYDNSGNIISYEAYLNAKSQGGGGFLGDRLLQLIMDTFMPIPSMVMTLIVFPIILILALIFITFATATPLHWWYNLYVLIANAVVHLFEVISVIFTSPQAVHGTPKAKKILQKKPISRPINTSHVFADNNQMQHTNEHQEQEEIIEKIVKDKVEPKRQANIINERRMPLTASILSAKLKEQQDSSINFNDNGPLQKNYNEALDNEDATHITETPYEETTNEEAIKEETIKITKSEKSLHENDKDALMKDMIRQKGKQAYVDIDNLSEDDDMEDEEDIILSENNPLATGEDNVSVLYEQPRQEEKVTNSINHAIDVTIGSKENVVDMQEDTNEAPQQPSKPQKSKQTNKDWQNEYELPSLELLNNVSKKQEDLDMLAELFVEQAKQLEQVLQEFGIKGEIVGVRPGPVVTLFELEPSAGTRTSRVVGLTDDIARSMSVASVRIAVVPGKNVIGIELPNDDRQTVWLRYMLADEKFTDPKKSLPMALGEDIGGAPLIVDLAKMPHLLIAGTTGSGKSVAVNTMIISMLYRFKPDECKMIMIDPKMLELSVYEGIPHLLTPVVTDPNKAIVSLKWAVREMDERYKKMAKMGVRNISGYNKRVKEAIASGTSIEKEVQTGFDEDGKPIIEKITIEAEKMPYIVIIIDEVADLMMMGGKQDIEVAVQRLAQKARAAGIHVIMATQRPSVDVITGTIKANFPTRISFQVTSKIDSRTILGEQGAEQLLGMGDMLYMAGGGKIIRAHGPFVTDEEVEDVANFIRAQGMPEYISSITEEAEENEGSAAAQGSSGEEDPLYQEALSIIMKENKVSISFIQRCLSIGYNRAARIVDQMESNGIVSKADHVGRRKILIDNNNS